jgi:VanZ family protein
MKKSPCTFQVLRIASWCLIAAAVVLTVGPRSIRPYTGISHDVEHWLAFTLVGLVFGLAYSRRVGILVIAAVLLAGVLEATQLIVPGRHAYVRDFLLNSAALSAGLLIGKIGRRLAYACES